MEDWIKVHEEMIIQHKEDITEQRIWLNDILDDQAIPYKNEFEYRDLRENPLEYTRHAYVISIYVHKNNEMYAKELIQEYKQRENMQLQPEFEYNNSIEDEYIEEEQIEQEEQIDGTAIYQLLGIIAVLTIAMTLVLAYGLSKL